MAKVVLRNMTLTQNIHHHHLIPSNNTSNSQSNSQSSVIMHHQPGKRLIAPAVDMNQRSTSVHLDLSRTLLKKTTTTTSGTSKLPYGTHHMGSYPTQPASVQRRNARERNRVKQVNNGFANLRQHIPPDVITALTNGGRGASKKLSKVDTLRLAVEYIRRLQDLLDGTNITDSKNKLMNKNCQSPNNSYYTPNRTTALLTPTTCSESSVSPTPSFTSDTSVGCNSASGTYVPVTTTSNNHQSFMKYEVYDTYNPEDEELLDCITWWQQQ